jgi:peptidoglycan/LPS O-acetylase OafA/YrhL
VGDVLYMAFARPLWTLGVAIVTFLCVTGEGGVVNSMLSWYIWDPIAKLTYSAYLIHPFLIRVVYYNRTELFTYSDTMYVTHFLAFAVLSYAVASGMSLLIETPFARLEKVLLKKGD